MKLRTRTKRIQPVDVAREFIKKGIDQEGFVCQYLNDYIGHGVFTTTTYEKHDFLLEYRGELVSHQEALKRERSYPACKGSFLYFFKDQGITLCVDATESYGMGKMVNDDHVQPNCKMVIVIVKKQPHLCLFALKDILPNSELRFDYGVKSLPWRKQVSKKCHVKPLPSPQFSEQPTLCDKGYGPETLSHISFCGMKKASNSLQFSEQTSEASDVEVSNNVQFSEHNSTASSAEHNSTASDVEVSNNVQFSEHNSTASSDVEVSNNVQFSEHDSTASSAEHNSTASDVEVSNNVQFSEHNSTASSDVEVSNNVQFSEHNSTASSAEHNSTASDVEVSNSLQFSEQNSTTSSDVEVFNNVQFSEHNSTASSAEHNSTASSDVEVSNSLQFSEHNSTASSDVEFSEHNSTASSAEHNSTASDVEASNSLQFSEQTSEASDVEIVPDSDLDSDDKSQEACRRFQFQALENTGRSSVKRSLQSDLNSDTESDEEYTLHRPAKRPRSHVSKRSLQSDLNSDTESEEEYTLHRPAKRPRSHVSKETKEDGEVDKQEERCSPSSFKGCEVTHDLSNVTISYTKHGHLNSRIYDKVEACLFCSKLLKNKMKRHLELMHPTEKDVILAQNSDNPSKEFERIRLKGNYEHNVKVLERNAGQLILMRRPQSHENVSPEMYGPCPFCLGFLKLTELWRHKGNCIFKEKAEPVSSVQKMSKMMLAARNSGHSFNLHKYVFATMKRDNETLIAKSDTLIHSFGEDRLASKGLRAANVISQQMRLLARLVITARSLPPCCTSSDDKDLAHFLNSSHFDVVLQAIQKLCKYKVGNPSDDCPGFFQTPSVVLKLGPYLKDCANLLRGKALRQSNDEVVASVDRYLQLHTMEYSKLSSVAVKQRDTSKFNKEDLLPLTEDVVKIRDFQVAEMDRLCTMLRGGDLTCYRNLVNVVLARVICFNKRRSGEASLMKVDSYQERPNWQASTNKERLETLEPIEKELLKRLDLVQVRGKRGRCVPVIITPEVQDAIDLLLAKRVDVGILEANPYIFPAFNSVKSVRGSDALRSIANQAKLLEPNRITSTNLRKYTATVTQLLDLNSTELEWLSRHLGHSVDVHLEHYRLNDSTVELTQISKLLMAVETGQVHTSASMSLRNIKVKASVTKNPDKLSETETSPPGRGNKASATKGHVDEPDRLPTEVSSSGRGSKGNLRRPWTKKEKDAVHKGLRKYFLLRTIPGKKDCEKCLKDKALKERTWVQVKSFVANYIKKLPEL